MTTTHTAPAHHLPTMKTIRFGIEIETIGLKREDAAAAIKSVVGGTVRHAGGSYDTWECVAPDGRVWKAMRDSSLSDSFRNAEIVSPILRYEDIETLQNIVRAVRAAGGKVDQSCGIHCHLDAARFDAAAVARFVKMYNKQEELIMHALGVCARRRAAFCKDVDQNFLARIEREKPRTLDALNVAWYGYHNVRPYHYDQSRYHALNLHALWQKGTIELRLFESTLHAGKVKAYVQLALALGAKALDSKSATSKRRPLNRATAKYDMRVVLLGLGLIGDEFKTARLHLLGRLEGSAAWKHGRPAQQAAA
jgi:hypothetical protein